MKVFINYFLDYFRKDFSLFAHLFTLIFIGICIYLNYEHQVYGDHFRIINYSELRLLKLWLMYSFAFIVPVIIVSLFQKEKKIIYNWKYLLFGGLALAIITFDSSYYLLKYIRPLLEGSDSYSFLYACVSNMLSLVSVMLPVFIIYNLVKFFKPELYGLRLNGANLKPYLWMILFMIPIVFIASIGEDFLNYYPTFYQRDFSGSDLSENTKIWLFELCYGFDFISVELLFRGFMVVALSRFVGKDAILPMVACYAFLHFGKPMMETVGSVFGGFALGVLAYKSRNIYGGIIVHLGVAWGMELAAFSQL
ncbi:MAG: CPBP family intramembrane metalloprotease [Flavobacteriales bacterium]|nr:CPBP family intramembrane metalloprotease [Flavobacteriales bacterium]